MKIVKADIADFDTWREHILYLFQEAVEMNFQNNLPTDSYYVESMDKLRKHMEEGNAVLFMCLEESFVAGMAWCHPIQRFTEKRLHIGSIAVMPQLRNFGIGKRLLSEIEIYAQNNGYMGIDLLVTANNTNAVVFYEGNGFETERLLMKKEL